MRIVQTFWTGGRFKASNEGGLTKCQSGLESGEASALADGGHNPREYGFGWPHAEYNLMSWALSCLSLREHYDEVVLYTDTPGKRILIDELHLPYTDVQVVFDDFHCLPQHWALAKIKTYSLQTKPFLHVDGDIFVPRPLPEDVHAAPLIAQNREIGTVYYRQMMDRVMSYPEILIPDFVQEALSDKSIPSYNMGMFGGSDLGFIHRYCDHAFRFMEENRMNDPSERCSWVTCNIFFEQIFFAALADVEGREVASVHGRAMSDNGYTAKEFCDLSHFREHSFFHILGGHKRNPAICRALERAMLKMNADTYWKLINLFPERNWRLSDMKQPATPSISVERCIAQYEDYLEQKQQEWKEIAAEELFDFEKKMACQESLADLCEDGMADIEIRRNPHMSVFSPPMSWNPKAVELMRKKLRVKQGLWSFEIAVVPTLTGSGIREVSLGNLGHNIVVLLREGPQSVASLAEKLSASFANKNGEEQQTQILSELDYLAYHGIIEIKGNY